MNEVGAFERVPASASVRRASGKIKDNVAETDVSNPANASSTNGSIPGSPSLSRKWELRYVVIHFNLRHVERTSAQVKNGKQSHETLVEYAEPGFPAEKDHLELIPVAGSLGGRSPRPS
jgi:hypothetical protein